MKMMKSFLAAFLAVCVQLTAMPAVFADVQTTLTLDLGIAAPSVVVYDADYYALNQKLKITWDFAEVGATVDGFRVHETNNDTLAENTYTINDDTARSYIIPSVTTGDNYTFTVESFYQPAVGDEMVGLCKAGPCAVNITPDDIDTDPVNFCQEGGQVMVPNLPAEFVVAGEGVASGIVNEGVTGVYSTKILDFGEPNTSGSVYGKVFGINGDTKNYSVTGKSVAAFDFVVEHTDVYVGDSSTSVMVRALDVDGKPAASGTTISLVDKDDATVYKSTLCTTNAQGYCSGSVDFSSHIEASDTTKNLVLKAGALTSTETHSITLHADSAALSMTDPGAGIELPVAPLFPNTSFTVPVYIQSSGAFIAYDAEFEYDSNVFDVTMDGGYPKVTGSGAFPDPVVGYDGSKVIFNQVASAEVSGLQQVATLYFKVKAGATEGATGNITGQIKTLKNSSNNTIASSLNYVVKDSVYNGITSDFVGGVTVRTKKEVGVLSTASERQLLNTQPINGVDVTENLTSTLYYNDGTTGTPSMSCLSLDTGVMTVDGSCVMTAQNAGSARVQASYNLNGSDPITREVKMTVLAPVPGTYDLYMDTALDTITELSRFQTTDVTAVVDITDGSNSFPMNINDYVSLSTTGDFTLNSYKLSAGSVSSGSVVATNPGTLATLVSKSVTSSATPVGVNLLKVSMPKKVTTSLSTASLAVGTLETSVDMSVESVLEVEGETLQAYTYLEMADGYAERVDAADLDYVSLSPSGVSVDASGVVTAETSKGLATVQATISGGSLSGKGKVCVNLADPTSISVTSNINLAENTESPVISHLGYQTTGDITVTAHYSDGSTKDMTNDGRTSYAVTSGASIVSLSGNQVQTLEAGTGNAQITATVDFGGGTVFNDTTAVQVVDVSGLAVNVYEHYTPSGGTVTDTLLSQIEGTSTYQNAKVNVIESYTNGTNKDVTSYNDVYFFSENTSVVNYDGSMRWFLEPQGTGTTNIYVQSGTSGVVSNPNYKSANTEIIVSATPVNISSFSLSSSSALAGYQATTTTNISGYVTFDDGSRRYITGSDKYVGDAIAGLLSFSEDSSGTVVLVDGSGQVSLEGNGIANASVTVALDVDTAAPSWNQEITGNLNPTSGDVDLGNATGYPLNVVAINNTFNVPVRLNTGVYQLGGFDIQVLYDDTKLEVVDVARGSSLVESFSLNFNANYGTEGADTLLALIGTETAPTASIAGSGVEVAVIEFKALANLTDEQLSAHIVNIINDDASIDYKIAGGEMVAGDAVFKDTSNIFAYGDWDQLQYFQDSFLAFVNKADRFFQDLPQNFKETQFVSTALATFADPAYVRTADNVPFLGDINDDGKLNVADARTVQLKLANRVAPLNDYQNLMGDAFPEGTIDISDTIHINKTLAKNAYFVESLSYMGDGAGNVTLRVGIVDSKQQPVTSGLTVEFEVDPLTNGEGTLYTANEPVGNNFYEYNLTGVAEQRGVVVHVTPTGKDTVTFNSSKITDPTYGVFTPLGSFDNIDTDGYYNVMFGGQFPVGHGANLNWPPTLVEISENQVDDSHTIGSTIGTLSTTDNDVSDTHTYTLVPGFGDNDKFVIGGAASDELVLNTIPDAADSQYSVRVKTHDGVLWKEEHIILESVLANYPPVIAHIDDVVTDEEVAVTDLAITLSDPDSDVNNLQLSAVSSNTTLIPNTSIVLGGTGANRTISFTPNTDQSGTADITLTVMDDGTPQKTTNFTFGVTVNFINDRPVVYDFSMLRTADTISIPLSRFQDVYTDEEGDPMTQIQIKALPNRGVLYQAGVPVVDEQVILVGDMDLTYTFEDHYTPKFRFRAHDGIRYSQTSPKVFLGTDDEQPFITQINTSKESGAYTVGDTIDMTFQFSEPVTADNDVLITFNTTPARTCLITDLDAVTANSTATCNYTIQAGDISSELKAISATGALIEDEFLNFFYDGYFPTRFISKILEIDTEAPTFTFDNNSGVEGSNILLSVTGACSGAACDAHSGLNALPYRYDINNDGDFDDLGEEWTDQASVAVPEQNGPSTATVVAQVRDVAGNITQHSADATWTNAAPTASGVSVSIDEDNILNFADTDFIAAFTDHASDSLDSIQITSLPTNGVLKRNSTDVVVDDIITVANIADLNYTPDSNYFGVDSFNWKAMDNDGEWSVADGGVTITVNGIADTPVVNNITVDEAVLSGPITMDKAIVDGPYVSHFKITGITNGQLFKSDGVTEILDGQYITHSEGLNGVRFLSSSNLSGSFIVEASQDGLTVSPQSGQATSTITVIPAGDIACGNPAALAFDGLEVGIEETETTVDLTTYNAGAESFWCDDTRGSSTEGWELSIGASDMGIGTNPLPNEIIPAANLLIFKSGSTPINTDSGDSNPDIETSIDNIERPFDTAGGNALPLLRHHQPPPGAPPIGRYSLQPSIKIKVPAAQKPGVYTGTLTLTIDKHVPFNP